MKLLSSTSRNEKVLVSKHQSSGSTYLYATVWNGSSWNSPFLMTGFGSVNDLDQYDSTYLANGDFVVVYSVGNETPRMQVWNGSSWLGDPVVLPSLSGPASPPNSVILKQRPGTNEIMSVIGSASGSVQTSYFSGNAYDSPSWSTPMVHTNLSVTPGIATTNFAWSRTDSTIGSLTYSDATSPESESHLLWTANGSGGGAWGSTIPGLAQGAGNNVGQGFAISGASGQFMQCNKSSGVSPNTGIFCSRLGLDGSISAPAGSPIINSTSANNHRVFDLATYETTPTKSIAAYAQDSSQIGTSLYEDTTNTWTTSSSFVPSLPSAAKSVDLISDNTSSNIMLLIHNGTSDLHTIIWRGSLDSYFTDGDRALVRQSTNLNDGYTISSSFAWDGQ